MTDLSKRFDIIQKTEIMLNEVKKMQKGVRKMFYFTFQSNILEYYEQKLMNHENTSSIVNDAIRTNSNFLRRDFKQEKNHKHTK